MPQVPVYLKDSEWTQISPDGLTPFRAKNTNEFTVLITYAAAQPPARGIVGFGPIVDGSIDLKPGEWFGRTAEAPAEILWGILQQASPSPNAKATIAIISA